MSAKKALLALRFAADPRRLRSVRHRLQVAAEQVGCSKKQVADLVIAVNEACINIMQHAYKGDKSGEILLEVRRDAGQVEVLLTDFAEPIEIRKIRPRSLHDVRPGGLGTYFIQASVDECSYGHLEGQAGNFVRMTKKIN
jgi:anti-sigma regulatory factor (Ser/Thr protein kinase)